MDYYRNWETFVSNIDIVPENLDGEKLILMVSALSRTREERVSLGREAAEGDKTSLECFLNAYVPMLGARSMLPSVNANFASLTPRNAGNVNVHYDSLLTVNGDITKETFPGVQKMCEKACEYTTKKYKTYYNRLR